MSGYLEKGIQLPWREAGSINHHVDIVDSDQYVVNKENSLSRGGRLGDVAAMEKEKEGWSALPDAVSLSPLNVPDRVYKVEIESIRKMLARAADTGHGT